MSDKVDKELEEKIGQALAGFKELRRDIKEKQEKKHWSEISVPFSLNEGLKSYAKYELDTIRKTYKIPNASSLKKAELIALLEEWIPAHLEQTVLLWDMERFDLLTRIAKNGGHLLAPELEAEQIEYFRETGLIYTGMVQGEKVVAVSSDLMEPISALKNNITIRSAVNRNTEWTKLTRGLLYYYGTLTGKQLISMVEKYANESVDYHTFMAVIEEDNAYRKEITINNEGFSNHRVLDSSKVKQEHEKRKDVPYYPFTKQQLLVAGEPGYMERNKSYLDLVHYLTKHYKVSKTQGESLAEECVYAARIGHSPNDYLEFLSQQVEFDDMDTVRLLMDKIIHLMNNTRQWDLKGHTSEELAVDEQKQSVPFPGVKMGKAREKIVKIGRNEPCPCGSGKKYKKCCGR